MPSNLSARDQERLTGCAPELIARIDRFFGEMEAKGFPLFVVSGLRTEAQQAALYEVGRSKPGKIVTNCDGIRTRSNHQAHPADGLGHAADCAFQPTPGLSDPFSPKWPWQDFGGEAELAGLKWGGHFKLVDLDHVELP